MELREVMTEAVVTAHPDVSVRELAELMRDRGVGSVVLVTDGEPVGFVTDRDLTVSVLADGRAGHDRGGDHASAPVITAEPAQAVSAGADLMVRHAVRRLVVMEAGRLRGIVTLDDMIAKTGDPELARELSLRVTRAVLPDFFFHERGEA